ncbi:MAG: hypothetical protein ACTSWW_04650 [Promethearchaeota archaeon]
MLKQPSKHNYIIFATIFLIIFTQYSSLLENPDYHPIEQENKTNELLAIDAPQAALDHLTFENDALYFVVSEKGIIDDRYYNLWYEGFYHDWYWMSYLSINDGPVRPLNEFLVVKSLTSLTDFKNGDFTQQLVAESIIQDGDVYIKNQIKLYPGEEFFVMTFMIWSETIDIAKAELFFFNDLDIDSYFVGEDYISDYSDDSADYDATTELIYASDKSSHNSLGWISTEPINSWDLGDPTTVENNVVDDTLEQTVSVFNQDVSIATKYEKSNLNANETWVVPFIYGFATSEAGIYGTTVDVKDEFINDFSVLNFTPDFTDNPNVTATILNGGQNELTRNVSVFRNETYLQSKLITLSPGELGTVNFTNLLLTPGEYNEITVSVNNYLNDYEPNNDISHTYLYQEFFRVNMKDLDGFDVEGLNVSLYLQGTQTLIDSTVTDEYGIATYIDLPDDDYTIRAYAPWIGNREVANENFNYPAIGDSHSSQTNLTTLVLHIEDVDGYSVKNVSVDISKDLEPAAIWSGVTDEHGNITFYSTNQTYDLAISYHDYDILLDLAPINNFDLLGKTYYSHQVALMNLTFHLQTDGFDLAGAKLEFYERINSSSYGNLIGFNLADSIGNVSIRWSTLINYSIRVEYANGYKPIGDGEDDALNFTNSPFSNYIYLEVNVSLEGKTPEDYFTEIILFNSLPISYSWGEDIDFLFQFNVTNPDSVEDSGPRYANETSVIIRNQDYDVVYDGNATNVFNQEGNHSFVLNTSSGYFTSDNPETYTVTIFAQILTYSDPIPVIFSFHIYNITTNLVLDSSSETLYWKDNFTISATYTDTTHGIPITNGTLTVSWGDLYLGDIPMQNLGDGNYTIEIDTSLIAPGNRIITVSASKEHYNEQELKFYLNVEEIPTTVNGSILFDSRHSQYVTTQNLTLEYNFIDSYRQIPIPDLSPMYQLINSETDELYSGSLTYVEGSGYLFDPTSALLPIGTYHGLLEFSSENYLSSFASVQIEVLPIPTSLNDTSIPEIPYELMCYSSFQLDLQYINSYTGGTVNQANTSYIVSDYYSGDNFTGGLAEISEGLYQFDPNSEILPIGTYSVSLIFDKANHTRSQTVFTFKINEIPLVVTFEGGSVDNDTNLTTVTEYTLVRDDYFYFNIEIFDIYNDPVQECNISYQLTKDGQMWQGYLLTDNLGQYFGNFSEFAEVGLYSFSLTVHKANYTIETHQVYINVEYPSYFGISLPYLIIGVTISLIAVSMALGYVGIRQARIPRYIKDLTKLEKILKKPKNILPDRYLSRIEQLKERYGNRWEQVDANFPLKQQDDEILPFIKAYQNATGRMLLTGEAKRFLDDLAIYSEDEIRVRLQKEHISGEHLSMLMEIILNYGRNVNSQDIIIAEDSDDNFDLDELTSTNDGDES